MTMGLACDRDGYDLRIPPCKGCGSRGCSNGFRCEPQVSATRRGVLGLLAAAPVIAPALAKAAISETPPSYAAGGIVGEAFLSPGVIGEDCQGGFRLTPEQSEAFQRVMNAPMIQSEPLSVLMRGASPWDELPTHPVIVGVDMGAGDDRTAYFMPVPNRLFGTYINEYGEAV